MRDGTTIYERLLRVIGHSGIPGAYRLINALSPRRDAGHHFETEFHGLVYAGDLSQMIDRSIFYFGAYAPAELQFLDRCAHALAKTRGKVRFFDVGANTGQHSLFLHRHVAEIHAFEPSQRVADAFEGNVTRNKLGNITIHRVALSDSDETLELGSGFPGNSGSRSLNWTLPGQPTEKVVVHSAGQYFTEQRLPRMDILKIDVEGHESKVLRGLRGRLVAERPVILMELIGAGCKGGFRSAAEFRSACYPDHELRSLRTSGRRYELTPFDWECECVVVIPREHLDLLT